ncbi:MAG: FtsW/RodA/SpoVE family cell cycle protein [Eubacterium sp.]|nr:FtsW/RodA/SpoVE family cell cycle protein [Eubacterium sp.]
MASKAKKQPKIKPINNFLMLFVLSVFQVATGFIGASCGEKFESKAFLALLCLVALEWAYFVFFYTAFHRRNFELELIAFFLSGVGLVTIGSVYPDSAFKQFFMVLAGTVAFTVLVFLLGHVDLCMKLRPVVAGGAILLLLVNLAIAGTTNGARNWIEVFGVTVQPSEFVKVAFIFVGAATLEKIQTSKNIIAYIVFSVLCVGSLILMRDFGTALIFFITFLIIAFMTSGDIKTIILAVASAVMGGAIVLKYKAYVLRRFSVYRHVWDDPFGWGMQQTRVLVGIASGGLFGVGIGRGFVRTYYAPVSDSIFGVICEEWGLLFGILLVLSFVAIAVSALINSVAARSAFYSIAAIAGAGLLLFQCGLNVFGITDILPLTGVTIPFISLGGSSMISCWAILAFIKAADVRTYNYLGAKKVKKEGAK